MKLFVFLSALLFASAAGAEPYVFAGISGNTDGGAFTAGAGVRTNHVGAELVGSQPSSTTSQVDDHRGAGAIAAVAFAPIGKSPSGDQVELVGRAARWRQAAAGQEWTTSIGVGFQAAGRNGWGMRVLLERRGDNTEVSGAMMYGF